ncbi:hypothetical protein AB0941_41245 [Streptomyces sp. NPDC013433]|uniref:hypothetical protein n=1 Tax=Streptomyces sp. NPDC013433 TaxID=3155604 RepID=UPI0034561CBD
MITDLTLYRPENPHELLERLSPLEPPSHQTLGAVLRHFPDDPDLGEIVATSALGADTSTMVRAAYRKTLPSGASASRRMFRISPLAGALALQARLADIEISPADPLYDEIVQEILRGDHADRSEDGAVLSTGKFSSEGSWLVLDIVNKAALEGAVRRITDQTLERNDKRTMVATEGIADRVIVVPLKIRCGKQVISRLLTVDGISRTTAAFKLLNLDPSKFAMLPPNSIAEIIKAQCQEVNKQRSSLLQQSRQMKGRACTSEEADEFAVAVGEFSARWRALQCDAELWVPEPGVDVHHFTMEVVSLIHHQQTPHTATARRRGIHQAVVADLEPLPKVPDEVISRQRQTNYPPFQDGWQYLSWAYQALADLIDPAWRPQIAATIRRERKIGQCRSKQVSEMIGAAISRPLFGLDRRYWKPRGKDRTRSRLELGENTWSQDALAPFVWNRKTRLPDWPVTEDQVLRSVKALQEATRSGPLIEDGRVTTESLETCDHAAFLLAVGAIAATFTGALRTGAGSGRPDKSKEEALKQGDEAAALFMTGTPASVLEKMMATAWGPAQLQECIRALSLSIIERTAKKVRTVSTMAPYQPEDDTADNRFLRQNAGNLDEQSAKKWHEERARERAEQKVTNKAEDALTGLRGALAQAKSSVEVLKDTSLTDLPPNCSPDSLNVLVLQAVSISSGLSDLAGKLEERLQREADQNLAPIAHDDDTSESAWA